MNRTKIARLVPVCALVVGATVVAGVSAGSADQATGCRSQVPAVGRPIDNRALPPLKNYDPCTNRLTMTDDALQRTGGPYLSQTAAEERAVGQAVRPTKVRSFFVTEQQRKQFLGIDSESTTVYPDREQWLVVVQAPDQGPMPSLMPGVKPWPRRYYWMSIDATTGRVLALGGNGPNEGDWPAGVPRD